MFKRTDALTSARVGRNAVGSRKRACVAWRRPCRCADPTSKPPELFIATPDSVDTKLAQLGSQGWELAAITPRSSAGDPDGGTTGELWVFKRAKALMHHCRLEP
jgi:hypothetical protein